MKDIIKNLYRVLFNEDLIKTITIEVPPVLPIKEKTNRERLIDISNACFNIDPTPRDEHPDDVACVHSLTTILKKLFPDFPVMTYTPDLLKKLQSDARFKPTNEFKEGNIIVSPTNTGNGSTIGHTGIIGSNGDILSNSSATGLWFNKFNNLSWIERYSRTGQLSTYIFELL